MKAAARSQRITEAADALMSNPENPVRREDLVNGLLNSKIAGSVNRVSLEQLDPQIFRAYALGLVHIGWELREAIEFDDMMAAALKPIEREERRTPWLEIGVCALAGLAGYSLGILAARFM